MLGIELTPKMSKERRLAQGVTSRFVRLVLLAAATTCCVQCALALDPSLDVSRYAHSSWKYSEGFAKQSVEAIAQTPDGYLWLGTDFGLYRFDGVRAVLWRPPQQRQLPSTTIAGLLVSRDGTLWIGTEKGLVSWSRGKLTRFPQLTGLTVYALAQDHDGTVWAGGFAYSPPGKLCAIRKGSVRCYGEDGTFGNGVLGLHEDAKGTLWAGVLNGFWRLNPGAPRFYPVAGEPYGIQGFADDDGALLIPATGRVSQLIDGKMQGAYLYPGPARQAHSLRILRDRDGGLWIGTLNQGLVHAHQGRMDVFARTDGLSGNRVTAVFEDREGSIWVATTRGLDRFRAYSVTTFPEGQGLSGDPNASVIAAADGSIWFNANGRLTKWNKGLVTVYQGSGARSESIADALSSRVRDVGMPALPKHDVASLYQDHQGRIWVAGNGGVGYVQAGQFVRVSSVPGGIVYAMAGDARGNLWISMVNHGLFHLRGDQLVQRISWAALGRHDLATAMAIDPSGHGLWLGFSKGGLAFLPEGATRLSFTAAPAFDGMRVSDLYFDHDGTLWVASDGGLSRLKDGRVFTLSTENGLPCDSIYWIQQDEAHAFWLYGSCGLIQLQSGDLNAWTTANRSENPKSVRPVLFGASDGVYVLEPPGTGPGPRGARAPDGKIWFPTPEGLSVIDPRHIPYNRLPPPVHIEQITGDGATYDLSSHHNGALRLPPRIHDLTIDYTALSLVVPEKVHFRFKLEGQDRDWREVINKREVQYSNLGPGPYRFRVVACNNSGVWNETGSFLDFSVAPAYYQTNWFRALCLAAFLALLWALYQFRLHQLKQRFDAGLEARVNERTRIARELHDTLLQSFNGSLLRFQAASNLLPARPEEAKKKIDVAIDQASQAVAEGRDAVQGLRASTIAGNNLALAIKTLGEELLASRGRYGSAVFDVVVEGTPRNLRPIVRDELYRIAGEAVRNAFRHAQAKRIEVELHYDPRQLRLRIRDDGQGMDPQVVKSDGREGHFGLHGMRERAKIVGAKLELWSDVSSGTEVELILPAAHAYDVSS